MPTEAQLARPVEPVSAKLRAAVMLRPIFNSAIGDWPEHLEKPAGVSSSVMRTTGRYKGNPVAAHARHIGTIRPEMFDRWLMLWGETADEILSPEAADLIRAKAARIAESLKLALFFRIDPQTGRAAA